MKNIEHDKINSLILELTEKKIREKHNHHLSFDNNSNLLVEGLLDSISFFSLLVEIENKIGVEISFDEYDPEEFTTTGGITEIVMKNLNSNK